MIHACAERLYPEGALVRGPAFTGMNEQSLDSAVESGRKSKGPRKGHGGQRKGQSRESRKGEIMEDVSSKLDERLSEGDSMRQSTGGTRLRRNFLSIIFCCWPFEIGCEIWVR